MEFHIVHLHLVWSHCFTKCYADRATNLHHSCGEKPSFLFLSEIHLEIDNLTLITWIFWTKVSLCLSTFGFLRVKVTMEFHILHLHLVWSHCFTKCYADRATESLPLLWSKPSFLFFKWNSFRSRQPHFDKLIFWTKVSLFLSTSGFLRVKVTMEFHILHLHLVWSHCFTKCYADRARLKAA